MYALFFQSGYLTTLLLFFFFFTQILNLRSIFQSKTLRWPKMASLIHLPLFLMEASIPFEPGACQVSSNVASSGHISRGIARCKSRNLRSLKKITHHKLCIGATVDLWTQQCKVLCCCQVAVRSINFFSSTCYKQ